VSGTLEVKGHFLYWVRVPGFPKARDVGVYLDKDFVENLARRATLHSRGFAKRGPIICQMLKCGRIGEPK